MQFRQFSSGTKSIHISKQNVYKVRKVIIIRRKFELDQHMNLITCPLAAITVLKLLVEQLNHNKFWVLFVFVCSISAVMAIILQKSVTYLLEHLRGTYYSHKSPNNVIINSRYKTIVISVSHEPLAKYIKLQVAHAPGMPGTLSAPPRISGPDMHHGTCKTHVPWCMPVSFEVGGGANVPGIPGACATRNFTYLVRGPRQ